MCNPVDSTLNGIVGNWTRLGEFLPKIKDFSSAQNHGSLSPLNGFQPVNSTAIESYKNGFLKLRGDHIYLPVVPHVETRRFQLKIDVVFPGEIVEKCPIISINLVKGPVLMLKHSRDFDFHYFELLLQSSFNSSIFSSVEKSVAKNSVDNELISIVIEGNGPIQMQIKDTAKNMVMDLILLEAPRRHLENIWVATESVNLAKDLPNPVGCLLDVRSIVLSKKKMSISWQRN